MIPDELSLLTAARLDALLADAAAGAPLLMRARRPGTVDALLDRARSGALMLSVGEAAGTGSPDAMLLEAGNALGAGADDLAGLTASPALHYALLIGRAVPATAAAWTTVAGVWASLRRRHGERGPALVVVGDGLGQPAGCRAFDDGDLFGPAEATLVARWRRPEAGLIAQAADAAAIEVSRGDMAMLARLLTLGQAERFDPRGWIARQQQPPDPAPLPWRGAEAPCPVWLARHDAGALRRRVWRGHLGVLLPWMEEQRARFIDRFAARLPADQRDRITGEAIAPGDHEWGHIASALRALRMPAAAVTAADVLRRVRNALAHGDPAPIADCQRMEGAVRQLLSLRCDTDIQGRRS